MKRRGFLGRLVGGAAAAVAATKVVEELPQEMPAYMAPPQNIGLIADNGSFPIPKAESFDAYVERLKYYKGQQWK